MGLVLEMRKQSCNVHMLYYETDRKEHRHLLLLLRCRGSLSDAIAKGAFSKAGADNGSSPLSRGCARGSNQQPGRPAASPSAPLLSLLGTARDIALGMHHLHLDGIVHGGKLPWQRVLRPQL
jgi:hypothetical protein